MTRLLLALPLLLIGCAAEPVEEEVGDTDSHLEGSAGPASESASRSRRDAVVDQARRDRLVGEESTGYLGIVKGDARGAKKAPRDLEARISHINIQRRALYTEIAQRNGATVSMVGQVTACKLFDERVAIGEAYRTDDARWEIHTASDPVEMPAFCTESAIVTIESDER